MFNYKKKRKKKSNTFNNGAFIIVKCINYQGYIILVILKNIYVIL